jgi:hypothetical protein
VTGHGQKDATVEIGLRVGWLGLGAGGLRVGATARGGDNEESGAERGEGQTA